MFILKITKDGTYFGIGDLGLDGRLILKLD
jgi:hypothetical protein